MSISHLSLVNQKLAYAECIAKLMSTSVAKPEAGHRLQERALFDAVVFHLAMALHFYLRELAGQYHVKNLSEIYCVQDLIVVLQQTDKTSSESSELLLLVETNDTWLNQLVRYRQQLSKSPEQPKERKAFGNEHHIAVIELNESDEFLSLQPSADMLKSWITNFRDLIIRQRETSAEF